MKSSTKLRKYSVYLLFVFSLFALTFCSDENITSTEGSEETIVGRWEIIEAKIGYGPPGEWQEASGVVYEFKANGTFRYSSDLYDVVCGRGTYTTNNDVLTLHYDCPGHVDTWEYAFELNLQTLILDPITIMCIEGCSYKYERR